MESKSVDLRDFAECLKDADKTVGISFDTEAEYHWIWYEGKENLTLRESLLMWGKLTDWVVSQAGKLGEEQEDPTVTKHVIRAFAKKIKGLGEEEWERLEEVK